MYYYDVWVRSERYRGRRPLTYSSLEKLVPGSVVEVSLQKQVVAGIVVGPSKQKTHGPIKPIQKTYQLPALPQQLMRLGEWLGQYYRASIGSVAQTMLPTTLTSSRPSVAPRLGTGTTLPPLTNEQQRAVADMESAGSYLLHGRTGSGKTRVYQELARQQLQHGRSVLILSPEISLTGQLTTAFEQLSLAPVIVLHSGMTNAQRFAAWKTIAEASQPIIVLGARSALFSPVKKLGLIVVDECHEPSYKQEQEPRYNANRVAAMLAKLHQSILIYGSATPGINEYYLAQQLAAPIIKLDSLAMHNTTTNSTEVIDLRQREQFSRSVYLSEALLHSIEQSLTQGEQSLLYLNRRGTARVSLCQNCGWQAVCPHCDTPLTYHGDAHQLQCHVCGRVQAARSSCPVCQHTDLTYRGIGTKALIEEVTRLFPHARVARFDSDTSASQGLHVQYQSVAEGDVDILVGTQAIAKGFDFPLLSTLGVVLADTSLSLPDFTASERTYQLITQVLGRVSRGHRSTRTFVQTYNPDSPVLQAALQGNWQDFYQTELQQRQAYGFPPFYHLLTLKCRRKTAKSAEKACANLVTLIQTSHPQLVIDGPAPAFHEKSSAGYTWQLVIKSRNRGQLLAVLDDLPSTITSYDLDPLNLL
jgi:primosomal protein N' (replication factor Y)